MKEIEKSPLKVTSSKLFPHPVNHSLCHLAGTNGLIFMTNEAQTGPTEKILAKLPQGTLVIFRDYEIKNRLSKAQTIQNICREKKLLFSVAGDIQLAKTIQSDGFHLPEWMKNELDKADLEPFITSAACHSDHAITKAQALNIDMMLISPVFQTQSHPNTPWLGVDRLKKMTQHSPEKFAALGGVNSKTAPLLKGLNLAAIAAITGIL